MEVYAAMLDNADQNIGKLMLFLDDLGERDNTIVLFTSDNGGTGDGGEHGSYNNNRMWAGAPALPINDERAMTELLGGPQSMPLYPTAWGEVSNTPFPTFKTHTGGGGRRVAGAALGSRAEAASARTAAEKVDASGLQHTQELFENASKELSNARTAAEEEVEDASSDRLAAMGRVGDLDGDGVDDDDEDGDGLPNEVEAGLDALEELLECVTGSKVCDGSQDDVELVQLPTQVAEHDEHEVEPDKGQEHKEKNEL
jgi:hypothetical protein